MSNIQEPPQILRVKRKRTDDPLQALVMETSRRQIKRPKYVFRLKRTEERDIQDSTAVLTASDNLKDNKPVFNLATNRKSISNAIGLEPDKVSRGSISEGTQDLVANIVDEQPMELNPQLLEMLNDYLKDNDETTVNNHVKPPKRRQSSISQELNGRPLFSKEQLLRNSIAINEEEDSDSDYVYDVYYRDKAISAQWENEKIGYIRFDDDQEGMLDEQDEFLMNTDDEDSNDENFYRNDYPEDEDAGYEEEGELESIGMGEPSDDQDDEFDILNDRSRFTRQDFMRNEGLKSMSDDEYQNQVSQIDEKQVWSNAEDIVDDDNIDFSRNNEDDDAMEMDSYMNDTGHFNDSDVGFERNEFFKSDKDDPIAIHRDRIFSKLQNMIDRKS